MKSLLKHLLKSLAFSFLVVLFTTLAYFAGRVANDQDAKRLAESEYYRGVFSLCYGVVFPTSDLCMKMIGKAYADHVWEMPDPDYYYPPVMGARD